ncbi:hypothetical protein KBA63_00435 [Candidatus Woesebacteria bacterium]|nr:hypothetical protein [Candidatus Woesebacteria bacterium]MBP9687058.1 hypothetical protein [Candidatus Woesebacteria bacterium]
MQPVIVSFSCYQFLTPKSGDRNWVKLSLITSYLQLDAPIVFDWYLEQTNDIGYEIKLEITLDEGETFERKTRDWLIENIAAYDSSKVFVPESWAQSVVTQLNAELLKHTTDIHEILADNGFFAIRSRSSTVNNTYHKLLAQFLSWTDPIQALLICPRDGNGNPVEYVWIFWDSLRFKNPQLITQIGEVSPPLIVVKGTGYLRYCLEEIT